MRSVVIHQTVEDTDTPGLQIVNPARVIVDGIDVTESLVGFRVTRVPGQPATVHLSFLPEELQIEGDFPVEKDGD